MTLAAMRPLALYFPNDPDLAELNNGDSPSSSVQLRNDPQAIEITLQPASTVYVGELFEVRAMVTISTGSPVPYATVYANIAPSKGTMLESAGAFLDRIFGSDNETQYTYGLQPQLDQSRSVARADRNGVVRFKLRVAHGISGNYALFFTTANKRTKSAKTTPFALINRVARVEIVQYDWVYAFVEKKDFPTTINIKNVTIKVVGGDDGETGVTPEMESLKIETANFRVEDESKRNVTGDIEKLRSGKGSGVARARALYNLLVEGAKRLRPKQKKSRDAKFAYDGQPRHIGGGVYEFINARLEVRRPGKFRTQFIVQGIATDPTEKRYDSTIESFSKNAEEAIKWVNTVLFLFLTVLMFSGNNANTPRWRILLTLVAGGVTIALIPTLGNKTHAETWRIMMYMSVGVTALFAFLALTMSFIDKGRFATHAAKREASMVAYVQRLWNHPDEEDDGGNSLSASATEALTSHLKQTCRPSSSPNPSSSSNTSS